jgi:hypothetical protein
VCPGKGWWLVTMNKQSWPANMELCSTLENGWGKNTPARYRTETFHWLPSFEKPDLGKFDCTWKHGKTNRGKFTFLGKHQAVVVTPGACNENFWLLNSNSRRFILKVYINNSLPLF